MKTYRTIAALVPKTLRSFIFCLVGLGLVVSGAEAKEWRGFVPLVSNQADFEKRFGKGVEQWPGSFDYKLPDETVWVRYSLGHCIGNEGWNVKTGTVIHIVVRPKKSKFLSDIPKAELEMFNPLPGDYDLPNSFYYLDEKNGAAMSVDGIVKPGKLVATKFYYFPTFAERNLKCAESR